MKRLHIIHTKTIDEIDRRYHKKVVGTLEREVLNWAKDLKQDAYEATKEVKDQFKKNPDKFRSKYFKYLKRLLELKLDAIEATAHKEDKPSPKINQELSQWLNFESVRVQEHISCSSISMYEFCPRKYYYRYLLGIKFPKTAALHFGTSVDDALNYYFEEKIKGQTPPRAAVHAQFYEEFAKGYDEVNWGEADPKQLQKNGPAILDAYLDKFDNITQAVDVQTEVRIELEGGGHLLGYIDILEEEAVVDTKTAKEPWNDTGPYAKHLKELQPKAYSLWFLEKYEEMPKKFRYQIVTKETDDKGKAKPRTQMIEFSVKKFELEQFRRRIQKIWDEVCERTPKGKSAFPAQATWGPKDGRGPGMQKVGYLCTREWCDYWKLCQKDGLDIPLKWVSKTKERPGYHLYEDGREVE